jgi:phasin family protein
MAKGETKVFGEFPDFSKTFGEFRLPGIDLEAVVASQRKNIEALTQANQLAAEGLRAITERQVAIARQAVDEASSLLREWAEPGAPEERVAKNAELAKQAFEKNVANAREIAELATKAGADVFNVLARRFSESFNELRLYAKKHAVAA